MSLCKGTDRRVHVGYDLNRLSTDHVDLTDRGGGEILIRFQLAAGEIMVADFASTIPAADIFR
jgi:hypothetical protein